MGKSIQEFKPTAWGFANAGLLNLIFEDADPLGPDATELLAQMTAEVGQRYANIQTPSSRKALNDPNVPRSVYLLARLEGRVVGSAALRPLEGDLGEVKRMFVAPAARRKGVARQLLKELEDRAKALGYRMLRLETGGRQPEAIALYEQQGFYPIPQFGRYIGDPISICFEKQI